MKAYKSNLPQGSALEHSNFHYLDSYEGEFNNPNQSITSSIMGKAFFQSSPKWVGLLFQLRNNIVKLLGLKTPQGAKNRKELIQNFNCEKGEQLGLFRVLDKSENEVILGEDDKHLNFRISLFKQDIPGESSINKLVVSTSIIFHNKMGRIYFMFVKPFHKLIVPIMLSNITRQLNYAGKRST